MPRTGSERLARAAREKAADWEPAVLAEPVFARVSIMFEEAAGVATEVARALAGLTELVGSMLDLTVH